MGRKPAAYQYKDNTKDRTQTYEKRVKGLAKKLCELAKITGCAISVQIIPQKYVDVYKKGDYVDVDAGPMIADDAVINIDPFLPVHFCSCSSTEMNRMFVAASMIGKVQSISGEASMDACYRGFVKPMSDKGVKKPHHRMKSEFSPTKSEFSPKKTRLSRDVFLEADDSDEESSGTF